MDAARRRFRRDPRGSASLPRSMNRRRTGRYSASAPPEAAPPASRRSRRSPRRPTRRPIIPPNAPIAAPLSTSRTTPRTTLTAWSEAPFLARQSRPNRGKARKTAAKRRKPRCQSAQSAPSSHPIAHAAQRVSELVGDDARPTRDHRSRLHARGPWNAQQQSAHRGCRIPLAVFRGRIPGPYSGGRASAGTMRACDAGCSPSSSFFSSARSSTLPWRGGVRLGAGLIALLLCLCPIARGSRWGAPTRISPTSSGCLVTGGFRRLIDRRMRPTHIQPGACHFRKEDNTTLP
jgi:hypothetical protein